MSYAHPPDLPSLYSSALHELKEILGAASLAAKLCNCDKSSTQRLQGGLRNRSNRAAAVPQVELQKISFNPNWICRELVEVWFRAVVRALPSKS